MSSNIIDIKSRLQDKHLDTLPPHERIEECFWHSITPDGDKCKYCNYHKLTAKMLFDILIKDMSLASKNRKLQLTNIDIELIIHEMLSHLLLINERINLGKKMVPPEKSTEEAVRPNQYVTRGKPPIKKRSPAVTQDAKQSAPSRGSNDGKDEEEEHS